MNPAEPPRGADVTIPAISISWHGGTRVLVELANHLATGGHTVRFIVSRGRFSTPFKLNARVIVQHAGIYTGWKYLDYTVFLLCLPFLFRRKALLMANFFVTYYPVLIAHRLFGNRYLYFVQDIESKYNGPVGRILNAICRRTYRDDHIVAASDHLRRRLETEFGRGCESVSLGPAQVFFDAPATQEKCFDIIYFGRLEPWKGFDRFERFMALTEDRISCLCVSQDERIRDRAAGPAVTFRRPKNDQELVQCLDQARLLLFTSYDEGFGLPPLEAMARAVPSVLFPCGGPDQYIRDGINSAYVRSEQEAVKVILNLIATPDLYQRMSLQAQNTAHGFRLQAALSSLAAIIKRDAPACDVADQA